MMNDECRSTSRLTAAPPPLIIHHSSFIISFFPLPRSAMSAACRGILPTPPPGPPGVTPVPFYHLAAYLTGSYHTAPGRNFLRACAALRISYDPAVQAPAFLRDYASVCASHSSFIIHHSSFSLFPFCLPSSGNLAAYEMRLRHDPIYLSSRLLPL